MNRREFLKALAVLPFAGKVLKQAVETPKLVEKPNWQANAGWDFGDRVVSPRFGSAGARTWLNDYELPGRPVMYGEDYCEEHKQVCTTVIDGDGYFLRLEYKPGGYVLREVCMDSGYPDNSPLTNWLFAHLYDRFDITFA